MNEFRRAIRFFLLSSTAALVEMGSFALLNEVTNWRYWPCYLIALTLSVIWNFGINRKFTFRSTANIPRALSLVFLYYLVFTPLSTWGGDYLAEDLHWNEYVVTVINILLNGITEFLFQRFVVYGKNVDTAVKKPEESAPVQD